MPDMVQERMDMFHAAERTVRMSCTALTPLEVQNMKLRLQGEAHQDQLQSILKRKHCIKNIKKLLMDVWSKDVLWGFGRKCSVHSAEFSMCKILYSLHLDATPPPQSDEDKCFCFPSTSLMLRGCEHNKVSVSSQISYSRLQCMLCSTCIRCDGPLIHSTIS